MWVDFAYYKDGYLLGKKTTIPESEFGYWERQARVKIIFRKVEIDDPPDYLKNCVCEVAEILYMNHNAPKVGEVVSESNASYSYKLKEAMSDKDLDRVIISTVEHYLLNTLYHNIFIFRG